MRAALCSITAQNYLRMTAKATQFGNRTFSSWLIESSGALPLMRRMDYADLNEVDNSVVMNRLYQVLVYVATCITHE